MNVFIYLLLGTYDVQSVNYTVEGSKVCITCIYRDTTNAKGCIAVLVPSNVDDSTVQLNIPRDDTQCTVLSSNATLSVYDWETGGEISSRPAVHEYIYIESGTTINYYNVFCEIIL